MRIAVHHPELSNAHETVSLVSFTGLSGRRVEGWLEEPAGPGKYAASFGARVQNYQWPKPGPDETAETADFLDFADSRATQKGRFGGELFPAQLPEGITGRTFLKFFQTDRGTGRRKGIVAIRLEEFEDD